MAQLVVPSGMLIGLRNRVSPAGDVLFAVDDKKNVLDFLHIIIYNDCSIKIGI